jgi:glyoxylase-like metal-dependent hydrolase (beta-lactamase superfamily II)/8-oxo-dGTP pyrophosphatase MutT (NUDIX family)
MKRPYTPPSDARRAASLLLLRDGLEGLEVLMQRRAEREGDMRSGVAVFPGGLLDAGDRAAHDHCLGPDDREMSRWLDLAEGGLDYAVAAVRETFEEVGLLLASPHPQPEEGASAAPDAAALAPWRLRLHGGHASLGDLCVQHGLKLDLRGLVYHSHWLTPPGSPKRFDTRFFAVRAPQDQVAVVDMTEAVELMWLAPSAALAPERGLKLLTVTEKTLEELARFESADAALQYFRQRPSVPLIMPRRALVAGRPAVVLPGDFAYAEVGRLDPAGHGKAHGDLQAGRAVRLSPRIVRVTAPNPGMMTGPGTNSYLVGPAEGEGGWTVIDPGPDSEAHLQALLAAAPGPIERILVTHTHRDHSPGCVALARATGAAVMGLRARHSQGQDPSFDPDHALRGGERMALGTGTTLQVLHTPGHASNHLCYLLQEERLLFTGDHVMQGSTVVINPPDGDMAAYLAALEGLLALDLEWLAPGHGFLVDEPAAVLRALIAHRLRREAKVVAAVALGPATLPVLVGRAYDDVPAALHGVAARSLLAHLLKLQGDGAVRCDAEIWSSGGG